MTSDYEPQACPYCQDEVDPTLEVAFRLDCYACGEMTIHQECLMSFFRKVSLHKTSVRGYICPRGRGKKSEVGDECRGQITSTHNMKGVVGKGKPKTAPVQAPVPAPKKPSAPPGKPPAPPNAPAHATKQAPAKPAAAPAANAASKAMVNTANGPISLDKLRELAAAAKLQIAQGTTKAPPTGPSPPPPPQRVKPVASTIPSFQFQPAKPKDRLKLAKEDVERYVPGAEFVPPPGAKRKGVAAASTAAAAASTAAGTGKPPDGSSSAWTSGSGAGQAKGNISGHAGPEEWPGYEDLVHSWPEASQWESDWPQAVDQVQEPSASQEEKPLIFEDEAGQQYAAYPDGRVVPWDSSGSAGSTSTTTSTTTSTSGHHQSLATAGAGGANAHSTWTSASHAVACTPSSTPVQQVADQLAAAFPEFTMAAAPAPVAHTSVDATSTTTTSTSTLTPALAAAPATAGQAAAPAVATSLSDDWAAALQQYQQQQQQPLLNGYSLLSHSQPQVAPTSWPTTTTTTTTTPSAFTAWPQALAATNTWPSALFPVAANGTHMLGAGLAAGWGGDALSQAWMQSQWQQQQQQQQQLLVQQQQLAQQVQVQVHLQSQAAKGCGLAVSQAGEGEDDEDVDDLLALCLSK